MFKPSFGRPENLWKSFMVEHKNGATTTRGRVQDTYDVDNPIYISAILCGADPKQIEQYRQAEHPISHVISHQSYPVAKAGDRLIHKNRAFYVQGVDNPGEQGLWTLYYCEERNNAHEGNTEGD